MKKTLFQGVCTALITPFLNDEINYPMMEQLLKRQLDAGIKAVVITGTTGEASTLTDEEKLQLYRRAKNYVGDDCLIIAGTGSNSTLRASDLSYEAQEEGADGLLIVSPYYNKATPEGLIAHYMTIAHTVRIPIIAYNVPGRTGMDIPVSVCKRIAPIPNIIGIKEASNDICKVTRICRDCPDFSVWTGNDDLIVPSISLGAKGVISVLSNLFPIRTQAMTTAALNGDLETASALQKSFQSLIELLFCEPNPIPVKAAMKYLGYDCGFPRLPLTELTQENKARLKTALDAL
jgi:4-hydroxy-tetrahydrodipicolinate synthase